MEEKWRRLRELWAETLTVYRAILAVSEKKRQILVSGSAAELETVTRQEEMLILQAGKLEGQRRAVGQELATAYRLEPEMIMRDLPRYAPSAEAVRLRELGDELIKIATDLQRLNQANTKLIEQALKFVNYSINLLSRTSAGPTYAPPGGADNGSAVRKLIDKKV